MSDPMNLIPPELLKTSAQVGDYTGEDGLLYCGKCRTPKQFRMGERLLPVRCRCVDEKQAAAQAEKECAQFESRLKELESAKHVTLPGSLRHTFADDDGKNPKVSALCRRYVEKWDKVLDENIGMLFYGSVGTGKSFFTSCVVNALRAQRVFSTVTSFSRLLNILQDTRERQEFIDGLSVYKLMVLDDLNAERETSYAAEQTLNIVEARSNAGLPIIVTSNLTLEQLENPPSVQYARIYDRVLELCPVRVKMSGESRRKVNAEAKKELARELLK